MVRPDQGAIYQGFWQEVGNKLSGGQFRVMMHCPLYGKRAGHFVRSHSLDDARSRLAWQLPVCELVNVTEHESEGVLGNWYRGQFVCPSNFYRKPVALSAPDLDSAVHMAQVFARGCQPEFADQLDCPILDQSCSKGSVDFRQARQLSGSALR
jgi:hypothetical protein